MNLDNLISAISSMKVSVDAIANVVTLQNERINEQQDQIGALTPNYSKALYNDPKIVSIIPAPVGMTVELLNHQRKADGSMVEDAKGRLLMDGAQHPVVCLALIETGDGDREIQPVCEFGEEGYQPVSHVEPDLVISDFGEAVEKSKPEPVKPFWPNPYETLIDEYLSGERIIDDPADNDIIDFCIPHLTDPEQIDELTNFLRDEYIESVLCLEKVEKRLAELAGSDHQ